MSDLTSTLSRYLSSKNLTLNSNLWRIQSSNIQGNGVFANRNIKTGEIIFQDHPLLLGPRAGTDIELHCVNCCVTHGVRACKCGLPICSAQCSKSHSDECQFLQTRAKVQEKMNINLFRGLTPVRALLLQDTERRILELLAANEGHGFEIDLVKEHLSLSEEEVKFMKLVCRVLDSNAFETIILCPDNSQLSVRGLYPLGSLMNHSCTPNTMHLYTKDRQMIVKATRPIPKDSEIFTTYTTLLWATPARRVHLSTTKHFWCMCERCKDPTEFGACLNALKCAQKPCVGNLLPENSLENASRWKCNECNISLSCRKIGMIHSVLGSYLKSLERNNPEIIMNIIKHNVSRVVPKNNHILIELKLRYIWALGSSNQHALKDIPENQRIIMEEFCQDILQILSTLNLGQCKLRGLLLYELHRCKTKESDRTLENHVKEDPNRLLTEAFDILENDISAPKDLSTIS